jgi:hypothetical protein
MGRREGHAEVGESVTVLAALEQVTSQASSPKSCLDPELSQQSKLGRLCNWLKTF